MVSIINQPSEIRLGEKIIETLLGDAFDNFYFIVAFAKKSGVSKLQYAMRTFSERDGNIEGVVGIDSKGTSIEGLQLLLELTDDLYIYHDENKSQSFHPKIYIFENIGAGAKVWIGSSNLTAGGLGNNYEVDVELDFDFRDEKDVELFTQIKDIFNNYTDTDSGCCKLLSPELLEQLIEDERLIDTEARINSRGRNVGERTTRQPLVSFGTNSFKSAPTPSHDSVVDENDDMPAVTESPVEDAPSITTEDIWELRGDLLWIKPNLKQSDVLYSGRAGTHTTSALRLVQAGWEVDGEIIDQTTYFRRLFNGFEWTVVHEKPFRETTSVLFNVKILGEDKGQHRLTIRHNPSGEAGQGNNTTTISWGELATEIRRTDLRGTNFYLYAPPGGKNEPFFIEIRN